MNTRTREIFLFFSGIIGFIVPATFALNIYTSGLPQNLATWGMIFLLDALGLVLAFKGGNKRPLMQLGWTLAAILIITAILFGKSTWQWGWVESVSLICCFLSIWFWLAKDAVSGLYPYIAAMYISFVPQAFDFWKTPLPETWWLWVGSIYGCILAILGSRKQDLAHTFVPWACIVLNALILVLVLR